jgi:DNA-binding transcriptional LysR family regulator
MINITTQNMRYAITVAKTGSFNKAANELFVSQSGISVAMMELEAILGFKVFVRSRNGATVTREGAEFIRDAEFTIAQYDLMNEKYAIPQVPKMRFSVSAQHYTFASAAFSELANMYDASTKYEFRFMETKTQEVISDVKNLISEIGIIYISEDNQAQIRRILKDADLVFAELFTTQPYVLVRENHPLATKSDVNTKDLVNYPSIIFGQEDLAPLFYSEEIQSALQTDKSLIISDRGALADLLSNTDAYLISSGLYMTACKTDTTLAIPLNIDKTISVGIVRHKKIVLSDICDRFCDLLQQTIRDHQIQGCAL